MFLPSCHITKTQKCKIVIFFRIKIAAILRNLEQFGQDFALHSRTTQGMCMQNIIGIPVIMRALALEQRFGNTFWIMWRRRLQLYQKHKGPTHHMGPNNNDIASNRIAQYD